MTQTAASALTVLDLPDGERDLIGLARVSTDAKDARLQQDALALAGCGRVYVEKVSTRKAATERPGLTAALDYLRPPVGHHRPAQPDQGCRPRDRVHRRVHLGRLPAGHRP